MNLNVASFNILCVDAPNGNSIVQRAPRVKTVLSALNADLIGFQEATPAWMDHLTRDYGDAYELYNVYRSETSPESTPIAWKRDRFRCLDRGTMWFSDTPEIPSQGWDELYHCPRIFSWVRLQERSSGREFCFLNTHFGFGDNCQTRSAQMLISFVRRMGCPCMITGDFNMEMDSAGYQVMSEFFRDVNARTADDRGATFHGFDPDKFAEHIDYCFTTGDVHADSCRILRQKVDGQFPSDHYALAASLTL